MNIDYNSIKGKRVLLFSGGMDCYIINELEKPDVLLYINNHSHYSEQEVRHLHELQALGKFSNLIVVDDFIDMSLMERDDYIIPSRNAYFILKAAEYGDEIILGATSGDRSTDKDRKFAYMMTKLLNHIYEPSHWTGKGRRIKVNFKYKGFTKQKLIKSLIQKRRKEGRSLKEAKQCVAEELFDFSVSCYSFVDGIPCGVCKPCTRKWLSILSATGVDMGDRFDTNPRDYFTSEVIKEWIRRESGSNNRGRESQDIINTLMSLR